MRKGEMPDAREDLPHEVDDGDLVAVCRGAHGEAASGARRREVRRPHDAVARVEERVDLALAPDVVAGGDHVDAGGEQLLGELRGDAGAVGDVLAVGDDEVDVALGRREPGSSRTTASRPGWPNTSPKKRMFMLGSLPFAPAGRLPVTGSLPRRQRMPTGAGARRRQRPADTPREEAALQAPMSSRTAPWAAAMTGAG